MLQNRNGMADLTQVQRDRARALGIADSVLRLRLFRGWSAERATGQLPTFRLLDGQRQRYRKVPRGKWGNLYYHIQKSKAESKEVQDICEDAGLPVPRYMKPSRRMPLTMQRRRARVDPMADVPRPPVGLYDPRDV